MRPLSFAQWPSHVPTAAAAPGAEALRSGSAGTICAVLPVLASSAEHSEGAAVIKYKGLRNRKEG